MERLRGRRGRLLASFAVALLLPAAGQSATEGQSATGDAPWLPLWRSGEAAFACGDLEEAMRAFRGALEADETQARSWNYLGGVYFARGDLLQARDHFARAAALDPRDARALNNLATTHERLGDFVKAQECYLRATVAEPTLPSPWRNLGVLYAHRLRRPSDARDAWRRFLALSPSGPEADEVRRELDALPLVDTPPPGDSAPAPPPP